MLHLFTDNSSYRPDTADDEVYRIQRGGGGNRSPAPSLAVTEGDYGAPQQTNTGRSTLQGYLTPSLFSRLGNKCLRLQHQHSFTFKW